jgi:hypothetical protein
MRTNTNKLVNAAHKILEDYTLHKTYEGLLWKTKKEKYVHASTHLLK